MARIRKKQEALSWGSVDECKQILKHAFVKSDHSIEKFRWLPEYDKLARWMSDTKGKGLGLAGSSGRGKTLFMCYVLPELLSKKQVIKHNFWGTEYNHQIKPKVVKAAELRPPFVEYSLVDEVGRYDKEVTIDYGGYTKIDPFPMYVDYMADRNMGVFFTTNLDTNEFVNRYGEHILNRIIKNSLMIEFKGESLW